MFVFKFAIARCEFKSQDNDIDALISLCQKMFISPNHTLIFWGIVKKNQSWWEFGDPPLSLSNVSKTLLKYPVSW